MYQAIRYHNQFLEEKKRIAREGMKMAQRACFVLLLVSTLVKKSCSEISLSWSHENISISKEKFKRSFENEDCNFLPFSKQFNLNDRRSQHFFNIDWRRNFTFIFSLFFGEIFIKSEIKEKKFTAEWPRSSSFASIDQRKRFEAANVVDIKIPS